MTPLKYFYMFFPEALIQTVVTQSNLYSVQKSQKCVDTDEEEMKSFIGMHVLMGVVKLPSYLDYWNRTLRYPRIADVMPRNRFSELRRYLHFVDNNAPHDNGDKLFKISPIIEAVRKECVKIEAEEYQSVDEQIIPSKTKHSKIRQYNTKKTQNGALKTKGVRGHLASYMTFSSMQEKRGKNQRKIQVTAKIGTSCCKIG